MSAFWQWLFSRCGSVGVTVPREASLRSIITFILSIMGITWPNIRKILVREVGDRNVELIEKVWELVNSLIRAGPEGIVTMIRERLTPEAIVEAVLEAAVEITVELLVERVAIQLLSMLNPVGAVLQAIRLIYTLLKWIFENAARIFAFVEAVVNAAAQIIAGDLASVAILIENALASLLPVVIDLFMNLISMGDLPEKVAVAIGGLQGLVLPVVETVIVTLVKRGRTMLASLGVGGGEKKAGDQGGDDGELGTTVRFRAGGEGHRIWVQVVGDAAALMMASAPEPMKAMVKGGANRSTRCPRGLGRSLRRPRCSTRWSRSSRPRTPRRPPSSSDRSRRRRTTIRTPNRRPTTSSRATSASWPPCSSSSTSCSSPTWARSWT